MPTFAQLSKLETWQLKQLERRLKKIGDLMMRYGVKSMKQLTQARTNIDAIGVQRAFEKRTNDEGARIVRDARRALNLTQREFAEMLGVQTNTVARWERGILHIKETTLKLVKIYGATKEPKRKDARLDG
jgi:DNA-binding transcriptional regulator YiaG